MSTDTWNADQYDKFKNERSRPFFDLMDLVPPRPGMTAVDLGCGTGALTAIFHERFRCSETVGVDNSTNMLASAPSVPGLAFELADAADFTPESPMDVVISNSLIHWIPDHRQLLRRFIGMLKPGGRMAIQFPNNGSHFYQQVAYELEREVPFGDFEPNPIDTNLLTLEEYAQILDGLGLRDVVVRVNVYLHHLERGDGILDWAKGTFLTHYARVQPPDVNEEFMDRYRRRLFERIDPDAPYLFTFRRVFLAGTA